MKLCVKCKKEKDNSEFGSQTKNKDGLHSWCKECWNSYCKLHRKSSKGRYKGYGKKYYEEHKESRKEGQRKWQKSLKGRYMSYVRGAKARNITWSLSQEEFLTLWNQPCSYCNQEISTIGLDRIDNSKGYELCNLCTCCSLCNQMKSSLSVEDFLHHIEKIYNYSVRH
jgi:hypothetical protein